MAFLLIFNHDKKHRKKAMTNYITPNANYDLFSTASLVVTHQTDHISTNSKNSTLVCIIVKYNT